MNSDIILSDIHIHALGLPTRHCHQNLKKHPLRFDGQSCRFALGAGNPWPASPGPSFGFNGRRGFFGRSFSRQPPSTSCLQSPSRAFTSFPHTQCRPVGALFRTQAMSDGLALRANSPAIRCRERHPVHCRSAARGRRRFPSLGELYYELGGYAQ